MKQTNKQTNKPSYGQIKDFFWDFKFALVSLNLYPVMVANRGLRSRTRYQTRQDWTRLETIPELLGPGQDYFFQVTLLGKIWEKFGTGRLYLHKLFKQLDQNFSIQRNNILIIWMVKSRSTIQ